MSIFYPERFFLHLGGGVWVLFVCFARKNYPWRAARSVCYTHGVWTVCNPIHKMHVFGFFLVFLGRGGGGGIGSGRRLVCFESPCPYKYKLFLKILVKYNNVIV